MSNGFALATELLPLPVGSGSQLNNAAPSIQLHYRAFHSTTSRSAPVPRIGTLILPIFDTSSAVRLRSPLRITPDGLLSRLLLQRSPPSLLTTAACSGLTPAPDRRRRGAHPHLSYSSTSPPSEMCS